MRTQNIQEALQLLKNEEAKARDFIAPKSRIEMRIRDPGAVEEVQA